MTESLKESKKKKGISFFSETVMYKFYSDLKGLLKQMLSVKAESRVSIQEVAKSLLIMSLMTRLKIVTKSDYDKYKNYINEFLDSTSLEKYLFSSIYDLKSFGNIVF